MLYVSRLEPATAHSLGLLIFDDVSRFGPWAIWDLWIVSFVLRELAIWAM